MSRDASLSSAIVDGELVIRIGVEEESNENNPWDDELGDFRRAYKVVDVDAFAKDVWVELGREEEDGTTPLHLLLDKVMLEALEQGSVGVDECLPEPPA